MRRTIKEWVRFAEELARENGGRRPSGRELMKRDLNTLRLLMYKHPARFRHIKKYISSRRSLADWVKVAEDLAANNGGLLPPFKALRRQGLNGLINAMYRFPEEFKHIKRERMRNRA